MPMYENLQNVFFNPPSWGGAKFVDLFDVRSKFDINFIFVGSNDTFESQVTHENND